MADDRLGGLIELSIADVLDRFCEASQAEMAAEAFFMGQMANDLFCLFCRMRSPIPTLASQGIDKNLAKQAIFS
jgi:hypothetical protein